MAALLGSSGISRDRQPAPAAPKARTTREHSASTAAPPTDAWCATQRRVSRARGTPPDLAALSGGGPRLADPV